MANREEMEATLTDVRRAYRLLSIYQRRMLDLVTEVSGKFDEEFYAWSPIDYDYLKKFTKDPRENWAWDMLPLYNASFLFLPPGANRNRTRVGDRMLEIAVLSDDGYDKNAQAVGGEPDASKFREPGQCHSWLGLYLWVSTKNSNRNWFYDIWGPEESDWPSNDAVLDIPERGIRILGRRVDLAGLGDREAIDSVVFGFKESVGRVLEIGL